MHGEKHLEKEGTSLHLIPLFTSHNAQRTLSVFQETYATFEPIFIIFLQSKILL